MTILQYLDQHWFLTGFVVIALATGVFCRLSGFKP